MQAIQDMRLLSSGARIPSRVKSLIPTCGGKQIPFCAYNTVGYREQARAQLAAMEPERRRAQREGRPYQPKPIVFDFSGRISI